MSAADHLMTVHLVSMGCARNDVDSEELAARMEAGGFRLVDDPAEAETVVVNTCGFIEQAKKDSVDTLLAAASVTKAGWSWSRSPLANRSTSLDMIARASASRLSI